MRVRISFQALVAAAVVVGATVAAGVWTYKTYRWKNFAEVANGKVYRSGQLAGWQLESAIERYGIRRVICLNAERLDQERTICRKMGVEFHSFTMPSDGLGAMEQFTAVYRLMNADSSPVLVHCNAGVARTGVAVALYRILREGWPTDKAIEELRSFERRGYIAPELQQHVRQMAVQVGDAVKR